MGQGGGGGNRRRGLIIRSKEEIEQLSNILTNDKVNELASAVEKVNPVQTNTSSTMDSEVFEIWQLMLLVSFKKIVDSEQL